MALALFSLPKHQRIKKRVDYTRVFNNQCRIRSKNFSASAMRNHLPYARLGLTVSKRVSNKATVRNRLKRLIRESFRLHHARIGGIDVIVVALPGCSSMENPAVRADLEDLWTRLERSCGA